MDIIYLKFDECFNLTISINIVLMGVLILFSILILCLINKIVNKNILKTFKFEETTIGIGNSSVTFKYDARVKEIAYKILIELTTRKIGIRFDEEYDVISEVYTSWYNAFGIIRKLLEEIPGDRIGDAKGLIEVTTKVLNNGLRPHLTKWQAKYRMWYEKELTNSEDLSPQDIQKKFPEYKDLINDLKAVNDIMINYISELKRLVDSK